MVREPAGGGGEAWQRYPGAGLPPLLSILASQGSTNYHIWTVLRIRDPDFYPSRIPDLGSWIQEQQQKRGVKKNLL